MERHFLDGSKHIKFADGSSKLMRLDGYEETTLPDGTKMKVHNGLSLLFDFVWSGLIKDFSKIQL